jgi:hypothetical protein
MKDRAKDIYKRKAKKAKSPNNAESNDPPPSIANRKNRKKFLLNFFVVSLCSSGVIL